MSGGKFDNSTANSRSSFASMGKEELLQEGKGHGSRIETRDITRGTTLK